MRRVGYQAMRWMRRVGYQGDEMDEESRVSRR